MARFSSDDLNILVKLHAAGRQNASVRWRWAPGLRAGKSGATSGSDSSTVLCEISEGFGVRIAAEVRENAGLIWAFGESDARQILSALTLFLRATTLTLTRESVTQDGVQRGPYDNCPTGLIFEGGFNYIAFAASSVPFPRPADWPTLWALPKPGAAGHRSIYALVTARFAGCADGGPQHRFLDDHYRFCSVLEESFGRALYFGNILRI
jgi:hypothetical protein